jgi:tetratricopeptide (TPR) repeat protein
LKTLHDPKLRPTLSSDGLSSVLQGLASVFKGRKEYEKAAAFALEALVALQSDPEVDQFRLANAYTTLGVLSAKCGRLDDAEANYQIAIELFRTILPESHPFVANLETNLGYLFFRRGLYAKALPLLLVAVPKLTKSFGEEHPTTRQAAHNYLQCVEELEKKKIAVVFLDDLQKGELPAVPKGKVGMILVTRVSVKDE